MTAASVLGKFIISNSAFIHHAPSNSRVCKSLYRTMAMDLSNLHEYAIASVATSIGPDLKGLPVTQHPLHPQQSSNHKAPAYQMAACESCPYLAFRLHATSNASPSRSPDASLSPVLNAFMPKSLSNQSSFKAFPA